MNSQLEQTTRRQPQTMKALEDTSSRDNTGVSYRCLLRRFGRGLLTLTTAVVALISVVPVLLLFFITAVPPLVAAVLLFIDVVILVVLVQRGFTPLMLSGSVVGMLTVAAVAVIASQQFAATPPMTDAEGNVVPGSIASLEAVELNGSQQWMTIRGHREDLPVLLFLAGGPGGSELVMTRRYLSELEKHFIIVNWDQPGVGKSYYALSRDQLTPERYVEDAYALTLHLRERFNQDKIYVLGESWGSILGVWLVQQHPDLFHAFISTGQVVDPVENDTDMHTFALQLYREQGNMDAVEGLRRNGPPPYTADEMVGQFQAMNGVIHNYMLSHAHGEGTGHNLALDSMRAQEYGLMDKVSWVLSLLHTFPHVYAQLNDLDLRIEAPSLDVPVYFIRGRWDFNTSHRLAEEYFALLEAPHKELIWFADSAHTPMWDEPTRFVDVLVHTVLADTWTCNQDQR
ncbi:MAG: alpha/beta hydrolase [Chloroflexaceae bacterium]|nr:alpha/beta hydrolase [Chloroflexaceae bacterium]